MIGSTYGSLTVVQQLPSTPHRQTFWQCLCSCGVAVRTTGYYLRNTPHPACLSCAYKRRESRATKYHTVHDYMANTKRAGSCRIWLGTVNDRGYGVVGTYHPKYVCKRPSTVHRRVFFLTHGYYPPVVMHTCDVRNCINPKHLVGGTQRDNLRDAHAKGRMYGNSKHFVQFKGRRLNLHSLSIAAGVPYSTLYWRFKNNRRLVL